MGNTSWQGRKMSREPSILCVNIDVDSLRLYRAIHGLPQRPEGDEVYKAGVVRFMSLLDSMGIPGTIFSIAADLLPSVKRILQDAVSGGHEIASHSLSHPYDLFSLKDPSVELEYSKQRLQDATGFNICGFRSPGYNLSQRLLEEIALNYEYDSSILPSLPYFMARAAVIGAMKVMKKNSSSSVGHFSQFARGWRPFKWKYGDEGLPEMPMSAVFGVPVIGTTLATNNFAMRQSLSTLRRRRFINIEFHAIDFMDASDGLEEGLTVEPAVRVPLDVRLKRFEDTLGYLNKNAKPMTLADAAESYFKE